MKTNFLFLIYFIVCVSGDCDRDTGPSGTLECISLPNYSTEQWGTCLTDQYIRLKSKNKHHCEDRTRTYCYYQCMIEIYNVQYGSVIEPCGCNSSSISSTIRPASTTAPLPAECLSPDGTSCTWYADCLERKYHCRGTPAEYASTYAMEFCNLYSKNKQKFSTIGQNWIDAVRKCLQVELVPFLRPNVDATCKQIRDQAFASHTPCYLNPYPGQPGICNLPVKDWWYVFWTIKSALISDAAKETLKGALDTFASCFDDLVLSEMQQLFQQIQFQIDVVIQLYDEVLDIAQIAIDVGNYLSSTFKWTESELTWYAYAFNSQPAKSGKQIMIGFLIADVQKIKYSNISLNGSNPLLNTTYSMISQGLNKGELVIKNTNWTLYISKMSNCFDIDCKVADSQVTAPPYVPSNRATITFNLRSFLLLSSVCLTILF